MEKRIKKQIIYGLIYLLILGGIITGIYFSVRQTATPKPPMLAPKDIEIIWAQQSMQPNTNECDLAAQIKNPNPYHFATQINYQFLLYGLNGQIISQVPGTTWLLPNQTKYILVNEIVCSELSGVKTVGRVIFKVGPISWQTYTEYTEPQIQIFQKELQKLTQGPPYAQISGVVVNKNNFDLTDLKINIILENNEGKLIGARQLPIESLVAGQEIKINYQWLTEIRDNIYSLIIEPDVSPSKNFLR